MIYTCPVCGADAIGAPAWLQGVATHAICSCCNTEFGDDDDAAPRLGAIVFMQLREAWLNGGAKWHHGEPPMGWSPEVQLGWLRAHQAAFDDWVEADVRGRTPYSDGVAPDGTAMAVRDARTLARSAPRRPSEPPPLVVAAPYWDYVVVPTARASSLREGHWEEAAPFPRGPSERNRHDAASMLCQLVAEFGDEVGSRLIRSGIPLTGDGSDLEVIDPLLSDMRRLAALVELPDDFYGDERRSGIAGIAARALMQQRNARCSVDSADIRRDLALELAGSWGTVLPGWRVRKRITYGPEWSLDAWGMALGIIALPADCALLRRYVASTAE